MPCRILLALAFALPAFALANAGAAEKPAAKPAMKAEKAPAKPAAPAANPRVLIKTSLGDITVELFPEKAPKTVDNFLQYVKSGFYDGTVFHRVINNFMIQGGGFTPALKQKPTRPPIVNEANNGLSNVLGTLAMARTADPDSASAQFFINVVDNPRLDWSATSPGYCVFGKVVSGMDVVDKIKAVPTGAQGPFRGDVPLTPVVIQKVEVLP